MTATVPIAELPRLSPGAFWYLATPYSRYYGGPHSAFVGACEWAAELIRAGHAVFCPIAHSHPIASYGALDPFDHAVWLPADEPFMRAAAGLLVAPMDGWQDSIGVQHEIKHFQANSKPVIYLALPAI